MNYAPNTEDRTNQRASRTDLPPVLASVPWLELATTDNSASGETLASIEVTPSEPVLDASFFQPHSVVAAADMELADCNANGLNSTSSSTAAKFRFDPPQSISSPSEIHTSTTPLESSGAGAATVERPPTAPRAALAAASSATERTTHLRFDAPVGTGVEHGASSTTVSSNIGNAGGQPSTWHLTVATIDNTIRRYHRVIVLAALLTAAGLMMLVLESQHPIGQPQPDGTAPKEMENFAVGPLPLAELMASRHQKAAQPTAKGPQPDDEPRMAKVVQPEVLDSIPLEPIEPYREPRTVDNAPTPSEETETEEESPSTTEAEVDAADLAVDLSKYPTNYPSTGEAEIAWPASLPQTYPSSLDATPNVARLTREIQSVTEPTTK